MRFTLTLAIVTFSTVAFAQNASVTAPSDRFQVTYAANLNAGDSYVDITNTGATTNIMPTSQTVGASLNLCANVYTFDPAEELVSCCTCTVTPNGLQSLSVLKSLISNPLTPAIPTSVVIKVVTTAGPVCNASNVDPDYLAHGLLAWSTTLHQNTSIANGCLGSCKSYSLTEIPFSQAVLSTEELTHITTTCGFIQSNGSGFGICKGCAAGGLGGSASVQ